MSNVYFGPQPSVRKPKMILFVLQMLISLASFGDRDNPSLNLNHASRRERERGFNCGCKIVITHANTRSPAEIKPPSESILAIRKLPLSGCWIGIIARNFRKPGLFSRGANEGTTGAMRDRANVKKAKEPDVWPVVHKVPLLRQFSAPAHGLLRD